MKAQKTINDPLYIEGIGIHSGKLCKLCIKPAEVNMGIVFVRTDLGKEVKVCSENLISNNRATILQQDDVKIVTPEHLLAACYGLGVNNLIIECDSEEIPIMDGGAKVFVELLQKTGLKEQTEQKSIIEITKPIETEKIKALPYDGLKITFTIEYPNTFIGKQTLALDITSEIFAKEIAPARTYGFYAEVKELLEKGLAKGASMDNAVVIGEDKYLTKLRFPDELVRHKILDLIGDLAVLGHPVKGHFIANKSGHSDNAEMVRTISKI
ncbi:UDP-3-O-acyl-N-acetylglucosamine deacetylase [Candidatus Margulisiibacteriota bacterium]